MSSPLGQMGGYSYESPEVRRLSGITPESYDYRDQAKTMSKLVSDVSYMAGMQRKMQKGIDDANQNFIQQLQSMINDILVILGGGGDTGLDFGDLKYIIQAIGALFGMQPGQPLPINLFEAAWYFFSNYIVPVANFDEVINGLIDSAIATILDIFGEVPIVGQALQQLAQIILAIRDLLSAIADAVQAMFDALGIAIDNLTDIGNFFGPLKPIWDAFAEALEGVNLSIFTPMFNLIANWTQPFVDLIVNAINMITAFINMTTGQGTIQEFADSITTISLNIDPFAGGGAGLGIVDVAVSLIENVINAASSSISFLPDLIPNIDSSKVLTNIAGVASDIGSAVQNVIDNAVQGVTNTVGSGFNFNDLFNGFAAQQNQITDINAGLAALQADQTGSGNNGVSVSLSFSGVPDTTDIEQFGFTKVEDSGTSVTRVVTEALDMFYSEGAGSETWLYTNDTLDSDYFEVSMVMPRQAGKGLILPGNSASALIGRSNASGSRRCMMVVYYNYIYIGAIVDDVFTKFGDDYLYTIPAGAYVTFRGGTTGGIRTFQLLVNNQIKATRFDTSNVSYVGSSYRHCGFSLATDGQYRPNNIRVWTMNDNTPVISPGVGYFHAYRSLTSSTNQGNTSFAAYSSNTLDMVEDITSDMSWSDSSQTLTVNTAGRYMVGMREKLANPQGLDEENYCGVIFNDGSTRNRYGHGHQAPRDNPSTSDPDIQPRNRIIGGMPIVLDLAAGNTIRPAHKLASGQGVVGDSAGTETWFTVTKIG